MLKLYLDTSVILKRYLTEPGTEAADLVFDKAEAGELTLTSSLWNIGEALGVLDERRRKGWLTEEEFKQALTLFVQEFLKLIRLKAIEVVPVRTQLLTEAWDCIINYRVYEADALQITTCLHSNSGALLTSDEKLAQTSRKAGIKTIHAAKDQKELEALTQQT